MGVARVCLIGIYGESTIGEKPIMKENAKDLTDTDFDKIVRTQSLAMVDFWTADCQFCRLITPIIEELAKKYEGEVFVGKIRADENPITAERFEIRGVPTLLIMKDGEEIDRIMLGPRAFTQLIRDHIDEKLKKQLE